MKGLILGASGLLGQQQLKKYEKEWTHLMLHSKSIKELSNLAFSLPKGVKAEFFPCDFEAPQENALIEFESYLKRLKDIDIIILGSGVWQSFCEFSKNNLEEMYLSWHTNYFYPLALIKTALPYTTSKTKLIAWHLNNELLEQSLWTSTGPILAAFKVLLKQIAKEQLWNYEEIITDLQPTPQSLKIYPMLQSENIV